MGMCAEHVLRLKFKDSEAETKAVKAAAALIRKYDDEGTALFHMERRAEDGVTPDSLAGIAKMLLAYEQGEVNEYKWRGFRCFANCFDSTYGWFDVVYDVFAAMAPYLIDDSKYSCDECGEAVVRNGRIFDSSPVCE